MFSCIHVSILALLSSLLLFAHACDIVTDSPSQVVLLQQNGTVDYSTSFSICPAPGSTAVPTFTYTSSSTEVLPTDAVTLDAVSVSPCTNVTALFAFDALVGQTRFDLTGRTASSQCTTAIRFVIAGFTIFEYVIISSRSTVPSQTNPGIGFRIISGIFADDVNFDYRSVIGNPILDFNVRVQFTDGSDSVSRPAGFVRDRLSSLTAVSQSDATSPVQIDDKKCAIIREDLEDISSGVDCGAGFISNSKEVSFGMRFEPYRDGTTLIKFDWDSFAEDALGLDGEAFETFLVVKVDGNPPPIVLSIEPKLPFYRAGGEVLTVVLDNVDQSSQRQIRAGDNVFTEIPGSFRKLENGLYEAKFITTPGRGTDLDWAVEVSFSDNSALQSEPVGNAENDKLSYVDIPLTISEISPPFARAGAVVTLTGYFDQFDPTRPEHEIFIGNKPLSELGIVPNITGDTIAFFLPKRGEVGAAYEFPITVVLNDEQIRADAFSYVPERAPEVTLEVYGASYDNDTEEYSLGECDVTDYEANLPSGLSDPDLFQWEMYQKGDPSQVDLLLRFPSVPTIKRTLRLPAKVFGERTGTFEVKVACTVQDVNLTAAVTVVKDQAPVIGVSLSKPRRRTLNGPNIPVRIDALVFPPDPECFPIRSDQGFVYEWNFLGERYVYSSLMASGNVSTDSPQAYRLGREFVIPQSALQYGNLSVSLSTFVQEAESVRGSSTVTFSVVPPPAVPVIGLGSSRFTHGVAEGLRMGAGRSYNPDESNRTNAGIDTFQWTCIIADKIEELDAAVSCGPGFLPVSTARSFVVSSDVLRRHRNELRFFGDGDETGLFYIKYSLSVGSLFGMSMPAFQLIEVRPEESRVATLDSLTIYDNRGNLLDWHNIPVFEDITIVPQGDDVSWRFDIVSPPSGIEVLNNSDNLILFPDYFDPALPFWQTTGLGIRARAMEAATEYDLSIAVLNDDPSSIQGEVGILIRTQDLPRLILPELLVTSGDTKTIFSASAKVSLDETYDFLYSFFLLSEDGEEYCLQGCNGRSTIQFRIVEAGEYRVLVRLRDMQGAAILAEEFFTESIRVVSPDAERSKSISSFLPILSEAYRTGDHGMVELLASAISGRARSIETREYSSTDIEVLSQSVSIMHQIVENSVPNTMSSKSYASTAAGFAKINADFFSSEDVMYVLFSMMNKALLRVPRAESLDVDNELLAFYNFSARHVLRAFAESSTSRMLRQAVPEFEAGPTSLLIDLFRLQQEHITLALSRDAICGSILHVDTIIEGGVPTREILELVASSRLWRGVRIARESYDFVGKYEDPTVPSYSSLTVGIICTPTQAAGIRGEATNFTWCEDVGQAGFVPYRGIYSLNPGRKKLFMLGETMDYVAMSGLAEDGIKTDTSYLVTTNVAELGSEGLDSIPLPEASFCLALNTSMNRLGVTASRGCLSADAFRVSSLGQPFTRRDAAKNLKREFSGVASEISRDRSSTILISSTKPGVFGAVGKDCPVNARKPTITPPIQDVEFAYLVFGGAVVAVVGVTVTWVATSTSYAGSAGATAAAAA